MAGDRGDSSLIDTVLDGRYRLRRALGEGGSGTVFAATHISLESQVAVKVLNLPSGLRPEQHAQRVDDFLEEARTLTRLKHPNVVTAIDLGVVDVDGALLPYFVMELCEGISLRHFLEDHGSVGLQAAWQLFEPLARATAHAHRLGVVHRDIKPGNVMLDAHPEDGSWVPKLIDFGVAKAVAPDAEPGTGRTKTTSGASPYTPAYAAPEQVVGGRTGPWTDVHALGLLFVELVSGMPAYSGADPRMRVIDAERPSAAAHGVDVGGFAPVIERAVALRPQDRFRDAGELLRALRSSAADMGLEVLGATGVRKVHSSAFQETLDVRSSTSDARLGDGLAETEQPISRDAMTPAERTEPATHVAPSPAVKSPGKTSWILGLGLGAFALIGAAAVLGAFSGTQATAEPRLTGTGAPNEPAGSVASTPAPVAGSAASLASSKPPGSAAPPVAPSTTASVGARVATKRPAQPPASKTTPTATAPPTATAKPPTLY